MSILDLRHILYCDVYITDTTCSVTYQFAFRHKINDKLFEHLNIYLQFMAFRDSRRLLVNRHMRVNQFRSSQD